MKERPASSSQAPVSKLLQELRASPAWKEGEARAKRMFVDHERRARDSQRITEKDLAFRVTV